MSSDASVTHWIELLRAGDREAARPLWERYYRLLVARSLRALGSAPRAAADEEDVALSAFDSFCRGAEQGRFPRLGDREDLWHVLLMLVARKAAHQIRDDLRLKRGGGQVAAEADLAGDEGLLANVIGSEPTPQLAAEVADECRRLLVKLGDDELLGRVATLSMEGYTVEEVAAKLGRSERTVARKLVIIRERWQGEGD